MSRTVYSHPLFALETFPVETREGVKEYVRFRMSDWVNVVAVTKDDRVVLVRQHRWGTGARSLEIPGGVVDAGETPLEAIRRELAEETGYGNGRWDSLGFIHPNPALQDNRTWLYLARDVEKVADTRFDPGEAIDLELVPAPEVRGLLDRGEITHALAIVSIQRYLLAPPFVDQAEPSC